MDTNISNKLNTTADEFLILVIHVEGDTDVLGLLTNVTAVVDLGPDDGVAISVNVFARSAWSCP